MMFVADIADEIYRELGEPEELSIPAISFWLTSNIGQLNTLLNIAIKLNDQEEFFPELSSEEKDIFKQLYFVNYFTKLVKSNLGASAYDWSEMQEGDSRIRRVSRNEIAKTYQQARNSIQSELKDLIFYYKNNKVVPYSLVTPIILTSFRQEG